MYNVVKINTVQFRKTISNIYILWNTSYSLSMNDHLPENRHEHIQQSYTSQEQHNPNKTFNLFFLFMFQGGP